ncbi:MAG: ABC transporter ATP-binding protein [Ruminococcus sp.]|nr:ABC transporter ATP-binding protein [Ruminococcus sp.]
MERQAVLSVKGLKKSMGRKEILHGIDMECFGGEVFGFLGPNGAGKTTTIKIAVGLLSLETGEVKICGHDIAKDFEEAMACVGGIVENPEMYKYMTGRDNLKQYARMRGITDPSVIDEAVAAVKLTNRIDEKVSKYSLGMRQRLGVAQALMHKPRLLILDEPTNGLDPQGIKELRDILKHLAHENGACVVVSSHLMSEMELMCDRIGIIAKGSMIGTYSMNEIKNRSAGDLEEHILEVSDPVAAAAVCGLSPDRVTIGEGVLTVRLEKDGGKAPVARLNRTLIENGIDLYSVRPKETQSLEDVFIELTEEEKGDGQIE